MYRIEQDGIVVTCDTEEEFKVVMATMFSDVILKSEPTATSLPPSLERKYEKAIQACSGSRYWELISACMGTEPAGDPVSRAWLKNNTTAKSMKEVGTMISQLRYILRKKGCISPHEIFTEVESGFQLSSDFVDFMRIYDSGIGV